MCAVEDHASLDDGSLDSLSGAEEGSSSLSSIAEDDISDLERRARKAKNKVKMMCSYGGRILPRPLDNQLRYMGGETRILVVKKEIGFKDLTAKLSHLAGRKVVLKYQLLNEDLDALISVTGEEDVKNMMDEYEKMVKLSCEGASVKLRVFLYPKPCAPAAAAGESLEYYSSDESVVNHPNSTPKLTSVGVPSSRTPTTKFVRTTSPPLPGSKLGKNLQSKGGRDEFGSLKSYQQQFHAHHHPQSEFISDTEHQRHGPGMFYHLQHHPYEAFNASEGQAKSPCRCCLPDPYSMLPPRHPGQRSSPYHQQYHQHHPYHSNIDSTPHHFTPQFYHHHK